MQVNVHEAKSNLSKLLELVEQGERVVIARNGQAVAELVPATRTGGFPFGIAKDEPLSCSGDDWWASMTDTESEDWLAGR